MGSIVVRTWLRKVYEDKREAATLKPKNYNIRSAQKSLSKMPLAAAFRELQ